MVNHLWDAYQSTVAGDLRDYLDNTDTKEVRKDISHMLAVNADVGFLVHIRDQLTEFIECKDRFSKDEKNK